MLKLTPFEVGIILLTLHEYFVTEYWNQDVDPELVFCKHMTAKLNGTDNFDAIHELAWDKSTVDHLENYLLSGNQNVSCGVQDDDMARTKQTAKKHDPSAVRKQLAVEDSSSSDYFSPLSSPECSEGGVPLAKFPHKSPHGHDSPARSKPAGNNPLGSTASASGGAGRGRGAS